MRFAALVLLGLVAVAGSAAPAVAQPDKTTVGVVITDAINISEAESFELSAGLAQALEQTLEVGTIAGRTAMSRLPTEGIQATCLADRECLRGVGQRLGVEQLLMVVLVRVGERVQVDATWVQISDGKSLSRPTFSFEGDSTKAREAFVANAPSLLPGAIKRKQQTTTVVVQDQNAPRRKRSSGLGAGFWVAGGTSVALGLTATVIAVMAKNANDKAKADEVTDGMGDFSKSDNLALTADIVGGAGVVAGVVALVFLFNRAAGDSEPDSAVTLTSGPGDIGFGLSGRF